MTNRSAEEMDDLRAAVGHTEALNAEALAAAEEKDDLLSMEGVAKHMSDVYERGEVNAETRRRHLELEARMYGGLQSGEAAVIRRKAGVDWRDAPFPVVPPMDESMAAMKRELGRVPLEGLESKRKLRELEARMDEAVRVLQSGEYPAAADRPFAGMGPVGGMQPILAAASSGVRKQDIELEPGTKVVLPRGGYPLAPSKPEPIQPTVGRVVHYWGREVRFVKSAALAAIVTAVHSDRLVNLVVFDVRGSSGGVANVVLVQPGETPPLDSGFCSWMPYQVKKASGSESGEKAAGEEVI